MPHDDGAREAQRYSALFWPRGGAFLCRLWLRHCAWRSHGRCWYLAGPWRHARRDHDYLLTRNLTYLACAALAVTYEVFLERRFASASVGLLGTGLAPGRECLLTQPLSRAGRLFGIPAVWLCHSHHSRQDHDQFTGSFVGTTTLRMVRTQASAKASFSCCVLWCSC